MNDVTFNMDTIKEDLSIGIPESERLPDILYWESCLGTR